MAETLFQRIFQRKDRQPTPREERRVDFEKQADAERVRLARLENSLIPITEAVIASDPDLKRTIDSIEKVQTDTLADTFLPGELHRTLTPRLAAIHLNDEARFLVQEAIDEGDKRESDHYKRQLLSGKNCVPRLIIGTGFNSQIVASEILAVNPNTPFTLFISSDRRKGGTLAIPKGRAIRLNSRSRGTRPNQISRIGGDGSINKLGDNAPLQPDDITQTVYPYQSDVADASRVDETLTAPVVLEIELTTVAPANANDIAKGVYSVQCRDTVTNDIYTIFTNQIIFPGGIGKELADKAVNVDKLRVKPNASENESGSFAAFRKEKYTGKPPKVMTYLQFLEYLGEPSVLYKQKYFSGKKIAIVGAKDSKSTAEEAFYRLSELSGLDTMNNALLPRVTVFGEARDTKLKLGYAGAINARGERVDPLRPRYATTAAFYSNEGIVNQDGPFGFNNTVAIPQKARAFIDNPTDETQTIVAWRDDFSQDTSESFDFVILAPGFDPISKEFGDKFKAFGVQYDELMDVDDPAPDSSPEKVRGAIAKKIDEEEIYLVGPAADLALSNDELENNVLSNISDNVVALGRYWYRDAQLARLIANDELGGVEASIPDPYRRKRMALPDLPSTLPEDSSKYEFTSVGTALMPNKITLPDIPRGVSLTNYLRQTVALRLDRYSFPQNLQQITIRIESNAFDKSMRISISPSELTKSTRYRGAVIDTLLDLNDSTFLELAWKASTAGGGNSDVIIPLANFSKRDGSVRNKVNVSGVRYTTPESTSSVEVIDDDETLEPTRTPFSAFAPRLASRPRRLGGFSPQRNDYLTQDVSDRLAQTNAFDTGRTPGERNFYPAQPVLLEGSAQANNLAITVQSNGRRYFYRPEGDGINSLFITNGVNSLKVTQREVTLFERLLFSSGNIEAIRFYIDNRSQFPAVAE